MASTIMRCTAAVLLMLPIVIAVTAAADDPRHQDVLGVAINGYDSVAYFTRSQALKGSDTFTHNWNDAQWRFISAEHRDLFAANPVKYAPRHGGF